MMPMFATRLRPRGAWLLIPLLVSIGGATPAFGQSTGTIMVDSDPGTPGRVLSLPASHVAPQPRLRPASRAAAVAAVARILKPGAAAALPDPPEIRITGFENGTSGFLRRQTISVETDGLRQRLAGCSALSPEDLDTHGSTDRVYFLFRLVCSTLTPDAPVRLLAVGVDGNVVRTIYLNLALTPVQYDLAPHAGGKLGDPEIYLHEGPWDGLTIGDVTRPSGTHQRGLKPSVRGSSPLPAAEAKVVAAFLDAYRNGRLESFKSSVAVGPNNRACPAWENVTCTLLGDFDGLPFGEKAVPNAPFYLKASDRIRIEWVYRGMLYYVSWMSVRNGKIVDIDTAPADIPTSLVE
jgi:hypothetical protein